MFMGINYLNKHDLTSFHHSNNSNYTILLRQTWKKRTHLRVVRKDDSHYNSNLANSPVAQWQSKRLLTAGSMVRIRPGEPKL